MQDIYLFTKTFNTAVKPTQRLVTWVPAVLSQLKQPRRKSDYSSPPSSEVKNEWSYTSIHPIRLHGVDRANFTIQVFLLKYHLIYNNITISKAFISNNIVGLELFKIVQYNNSSPSADTALDQRWCHDV